MGKRLISLALVLTSHNLTFRVCLMNTRIRNITWFVIAYLTAAFVWWACLLYKKNEESLNFARKYYHELHSKNGLDYHDQPDYQEVWEKHKRQHLMIVGEGCVFIALLFFGLFQINKSYRRELGVEKQRRNFLLSITHELKSPIAGIRLVLETLLKRTLEKAQSDRLSQNALKDADRLQNLVNDLLLAARLEDRWQPQNEPVNLAELLTEAVNRLKIHFPERQFLVKIEAESPFLEGDRQGLTAVFQNLLENAVKYSPEDSPVSTRLFSEKNGLKFTVSDLGIGIPTVERGLVFGKFYRVGSEETRETKGTGLGLFIVREVLKAHKSSIAISENQPCGTVFTIHFSSKNR